MIAGYIDTPVYGCTVPCRGATQSGIRELADNTRPAIHPSPAKGDTMPTDQTLTLPQLITGTVCWDCIGLTSMVPFTKQGGHFTTQIRDDILYLNQQKPIQYPTPKCKICGLQQAHLWGLRTEIGDKIGEWNNTHVQRWPAASSHM